MLRGWEGQAAGDPENYRVQGEPLGLSVEVGACGLRDHQNQKHLQVCPSPILQMEKLRSREN